MNFYHGIYRSVAESIAAVIGVDDHKNGFFKGNGWRVDWCVGHLACLSTAEMYNSNFYTINLNNKFEKLDV